MLGKYIIGPKHYYGLGYISKKAWPSMSDYTVAQAYPYLRGYVVKPDHTYGVGNLGQEMTNKTRATIIGLTAAALIGWCIFTKKKG